jgi:hypothetical protein
MSMPGFQVPNVTVTSARTAATRQVDRDHGGAAAARPGPVRQRGQRGHGLAQATAAADAQEPVEDQVRGVHLGGHTGIAGLGQLASGCRQRRRALLVYPLARGDGHHPRPAAGQPGPRVQGVAAVVTAPGEHHDPRSVDPAGQSRAHRGEAGRCALHQRSWRQAGHEGAFGHPDNFDAVCVSHAPVLTPRPLRRPC